MKQGVGCVSLLLLTRLLAGVVAQSGVTPVPVPRLDGVEPAVAAHVAEARNALDETVARKGTSSSELAEAYGSLARVFHAYEFFESAEVAYLDAERLAPGDGRWPHLLGFLYEQTGRLTEAAEAFGRARRVQPNDRPVVVYLGEVFIGLNRLREAREQFESIVGVFPAVAQRGLGEVALREGKFAEALEHFSAALARAPQAASLHYSMAMAYRGLGRLDQARSQLQQKGSGTVRAADALVDGVQDLVRGERPLVMKGRRLYEAGRFDEAARAFRQALEANPASTTAQVNLGLSLLQRGDLTSASEHFGAALSREPDNHEAHVGLGLVLVRQGRDADAVAHLQAAYEQTPDDVSTRSELVGALLRLGREGAAIDVLTAASSRDPDDEPTIVSLSILLARHARYREAISLLDEAHRRSPDRRPTSTTLARLLASSPDLALRDGARALELARAVYDAEPTSTYGETVALALAELGRCDEAAQWMKRAVAEAERNKDAAEARRLGGELPKYQGSPCRP